MSPALVVALLWMLFAGTHFGLSNQRVRTALVERLGELGVLTLFYAVASAVGPWSSASARGEQTGDDQRMTYTG